MVDMLANVEPAMHHAAGMMMMSPGLTTFFTTFKAMPPHVGPLSSGDRLCAR